MNLTYPNPIEWLCACYLARRQMRGMIFSERKVFEDGLRPYCGDGRSVVAYPSAWLFIRLKDVRRAGFDVEARRIHRRHVALATTPPQSSPTPPQHEPNSL